MNYGEKLAHLIREKGITQRELASKSQLDESTISLYISNKRTPNMKNHVRICKALEIQSNFFAN